MSIVFACPGLHLNFPYETIPSFLISCDLVRINHALAHGGPLAWACECMHPVSHNDWFRNGQVNQFWTTQIKPKISVELQGKRNSLFYERMKKIKAMIGAISSHSVNTRRKSVWVWNHYRRIIERMRSSQNVCSEPSAFSHDECIGPFWSVNQSLSNLVEFWGFLFWGFWFVLSFITKRIMMKATFIIFFHIACWDICLSKRLKTKEITSLFLFLYFYFFIHLTNIYWVFITC